MPAEKTPSYDPSCYLCPGNQRVSGTQNPAYTSTYVFDNDFQALLRPEQSTGAAESTDLFSDSDLFKAEPDWGICRVGCFSPRHDLSLPELSQSAVEEVVRMWGQESQTLGSLDFINYVQVFENKGAMMGCSNPHPHGQIWSTEHLPREVEKEDNTQRAFYQANGRTMVAEILAEEQRRAERIVYTNTHWSIIVPFWAVWPFEVMLIPHRPVQWVSDLSGAERDALADALSALTVRYDNLFQTSFPYSMGFHQAPVNSGEQPHWHLHAHFYPPLLRSATVKKHMKKFVSGN
jgi:UDPglucose--hexose-1-phosphate uridylyltransferase